MDREEVVNEYKYEYLVIEDFLCAIILNPDTGTYCGYLGLPPRHPWVGISLNDLPVSVHGGVTYAKPQLGMEDAPHPFIAWWVGFDCNHYQDFSPVMHALMVEHGIVSTTPEQEMARMGSTFKDRNYVATELESMVQQASEAWLQLGGIDPVVGEARTVATMAEYRRSREEFHRQAMAFSEWPDKSFEGILRFWETWKDTVDDA